MTSSTRSDEYPPVSGVRVGVLIQVGNWGLWEELATGCVDHVVDSTDTAFILVSSHVRGKERLVKRRYGCANVITVPNYGADIAPFFTELWNLGQRIRDADFIIKLHTKTNDSWRRGMIEPICGTHSAVSRSLETLRSSPTLGILGATEYAFFIDSNDEIIIENEFATRYRLNTSFYAIYDRVSNRSQLDEHFYRNWRGNTDLESLTDQELLSHFRERGRSERRVFSESMQNLLESEGYPKFIAGTIFWFRVAPMADFLNRYRADEIALTMSSEKGYFRDEHIDRITHAWERCLSILFHSRGYELAGSS